MTNPIEMDANTFVDWAEQEFGVDYDDVSLWDMQADLSSTMRMPTEFEIGTGGKIPAALYDILVARKASRKTTKAPQMFRGAPPLSEWELRDGTAE